MAEFIKKGYNAIPDDLEYLFPTDYFNLFYKSAVSEKANGEDDEAFLKRVIRTILKERYWEDERDEKRWLKLVPDRIKSIATDSADTLLSLISETYCYRDKKIHTRIQEDVLTPELSDSPFNLDFPEEDKQFVSERECTFSVEHKNSAQDPSIRCDVCNGSGLVKCEHCDGTGREQYVDGYYASGEERIKTGVCSECGGRGRVQCPNCQGEGNVLVYAPEYSIVKSVDEKVYHNVVANYWTPWRFESQPIYYNRVDNEEVEEYDDPSERAYQRTYNNAAVAVFRVANNTPTVRMKNRGTKILDRSDEVLKEIKDLGLEEAYKQNLTRLDFDDKNLFVGRCEQHIVIPSTKMTVELKGSDGETYDLYLYPIGDGKVKLIWHNYNFVSSPKYLATRFYYFLVHLGKLVLRPFGL